MKLALPLLAFVCSVVSPVEASPLRGAGGAFSPARKLSEEGLYFLVSHIDKNKAWCITAVEGNKEFGNLKLRPCNFETEPANQLFYPHRNETTPLVSYKIASAYDDKCIAINHGGNAFNGVRARLADCKSKLNDFAFEGQDDFIQIVIDQLAQPLCITNVGPNPHPNDFIHAKPCQERPNFKWTAVVSSKTLPYEDECFFLESGGGCAAPKGRGTKVFLQECELPERQWAAEVVDQVTGATILHSKRDDRLCLRAGKGNIVEDGTVMWVQACDGTDELQTFVFDGSRVKLASRSDLCMAYRGTTANIGVDPIIMKTCKDIHDVWTGWPEPMCEEFASETIQMNLTGTGASIFFTFAGLPDAEEGTNVTLTTFIEGDLSADWPHVEFFEVLEDEEDVSLGYNPAPGDTVRDYCNDYNCCGNTQTFTISAEDFNQWKQDGDVVVELDASFDVDLFSCGNYGQVSFSYSRCERIMPPSVCEGLTCVKITGTSASAGELGYFIVDVSIFSTKTALVASDYVDFWFADPLGTAIIDPSNVPNDTGVTYFEFVGGVWTVAGGGGDSLTALNGDIVWIAGTSYTVVGQFGLHDFNDVTWSTESI